MRRGENYLFVNKIPNASQSEKHTPFQTTVVKTYSLFEINTAQNILGEKPPWGVLIKFVLKTILFEAAHAYLAHN